MGVGLGIAGFSLSLTLWLISLADLSALRCGVRGLFSNTSSPGGQGRIQVVIAALVLIGAPGAGKSAVLDALATLLEREGVEHGAIESEQLTRGFPPLANAALAEQLAAVLAFQRGAGRRLFLIVLTAESDAELGLVLEATGAERALVVCLRAGDDVLAARVGDREPDSWPGKAALIAHARALANVVPALAGIDLILDTDGRDAEDVARTVLAAMRERELL